MLNICVRGINNDCIVQVSAFFNLKKKKDWFNNPNVKSIIKNIDNTIAVKDEYLESPVFGGMSPERLSGGCKAVILMELLDRNIYATNCGDNCVPDILKIAERKDITITLHHPMRFPDKFEAYMIDLDRYIHSYEEFIYAFYEIRDAEEEEFLAGKSEER